MELRKIVKKGMILACVSAMIVSGCGQQGEAEGNSTVNTESTEVSSTYSEAVKGSKVYVDATTIELSDEGITVDGETASTNEESAVYTANDIVFYLEGQDFTYGEGEEADEHSQEEADAHTVVHITKPGTYVVSGKLSAGQIAVDLGEDAKKDPEAVVTLILNGVDIKCSVAPAVIFYKVYECGSDDTETASAMVDTSAAGANVVIADDSRNYVTGSYVARIYKPESVELSEDGTEVASSKKLHKYDGAFYSKMSMNINGDEKGNGCLDIKAENEGLDSELHLTINGGHITIVSGNDGINTNEDGVSVTTVNGGSLTITVSGETGEGDGIDSNGWIVINGGDVVAQACSRSGDSGIDSDMGIYINGGTVFASGNMYDRIDGGEQNYIVFQFASSQKGGDEYALKNEDGKTICTYTPENDFIYMVCSFGELSEGTYTLWKGDDQLAGSAGSSAGGFGGMMGGFGGGEMPERMERPENGEMPEGMERPENGEMPEGMERPENGEIPEGMKWPEDGEMPEGMKRPEDGEMPEDVQRPGGGRGEMGALEDVELSTEFEIKAGGNFFTNISVSK